MNPIYKFTLALNSGAENQVFPLYGSDLAKEYELQTNEQFYRAKLSGKLTFVATDYNTIANAVFDTKFTLKLYISYNAGGNWSLYWTGQFWKTDCEFDTDNKNITVIPTVVDKYTDVLAGLEKEFNLIDLAPAMLPVGLKKRPCFQIYVPHGTSVGQIMPGNNMYWETECEELSGESWLRFGLVVRWFSISASFFNVGNINVDDRLFFSTYELQPDSTYTFGSYTLQITQVGSVYDIILTRNSDGAQWRNQQADAYIEATLSYVYGTTYVSDYVTIKQESAFECWGRTILDKDTDGALPILIDDPVFNNRNYKYCIPFPDPDSALVVMSGNMSTTPTPYGIYQPGKYYDTPDTSHHWIPIAVNSWRNYSVWLSVERFNTIFSQADSQYSASAVLQHAYPIASVISALLGQIAPNIYHSENENYSQFLYASVNPVSGISQKVLIVPKSNVTTLGYDQPAQKATITLKQILDMLKDCCRCFWWIDNSNRLRIEHIKYFRNGETYNSGTPETGRDLTTESVSRNGKKWAFDTSKYQYDKPAMAARYQFGWMDRATQIFDGYPIDIVSQYVNPENIEQIDIARFSSDVDYMLLSPGEISKDGFAIIGAALQSHHISLSNREAVVMGVDYRNTIYVNIPAGQSYSMRVSGTARVQGNAFWIYRNGTITADGIVYDTTSQFTAAQNITSIGIGIQQGLIMSAGNVTLYIEMDSGQSYEIPIIAQTINNIGYKIQNWYWAFMFLQRYYVYDMPAVNYKINGTAYTAQGTKKLKIQTLKFPCLTDPNMMQLIKTNLGNGTIQKLSVNLSSRNANATLKYDT